MTPPRALLLTGTCGSGKSTVAALLAARHGWARFSEDDVWRERFHRDRGEIGSLDHLRKRAVVRAEIFTRIRIALAAGRDVVVDATVHEGTADSWDEYRSFFEGEGTECALRVLHPRLEVAVGRDAERSGWSAGPARVEALRRKFTGSRFAGDVFLDTSDEAPEDTVGRVLDSLAGR